MRMEGGGTVTSTCGGGTSGERGLRAALQGGDIAGTQGEVAGKGQRVVGRHPSLWTQGTGCT